MFKSLVEDGKKCLKCKKPTCSKGCPVNTPIKEMIEMFESGQIKKAGEMLFNNNPLSVVCSLVCPHEKQCEGHCVLSKKGSSVNISEIEHYISTYYLNLLKTNTTIDLQKKIAIIGSGPAGITIAILMAQKGFNVTLFDAHDHIGGVLMYGIPEFRLPKALLIKLQQKMKEMGIKIRFNTMIGPTLTVDDLFRDGYLALFIGTGVWKPKMLGIKGESLGHVHFAIDYLKNPSIYDLGQHLTVIGAGNVAMDVARTAIREGVRKVTILYRGDAHSMTADRSEIEFAKIDGVKFEFLKAPIEINDFGIIYNETEMIEASGYEVAYVKDAIGLWETDSVIVSISQGPRANIVSTTKGIQIDEKGLVATNELGHTTRPGVFASGDVVTGAKTVVEAVRVSKIVANAMEEYINNTYYTTDK